MKISELLLRRTIPVVINSFNQLTYLQNIIKKFQMNDFKNIVILDNNSDYPPLLEFYKELINCSIAIVLYYNNNNGPRYFHQSELYKIYSTVPHLYTDPDLDFEYLSSDYLSKLLEISNKYKIFKVGSALEIPTDSEIKSDLFMRPGDSDLAIPVKEWEARFWLNEIETEIYNAPIDTTLHLFNPEYYSSDSPYLIGIRIGLEGFRVKHLPWYKNNLMNSNEYHYYKQRAGLYNNY